MAIIQEPSPLIFAALHYTFSKYFVIDELLSHGTKSRPNRPWVENPKHQNTFVFAFEYCIVAEDE